jgi:hypothetical protein
LRGALPAGFAPGDYTLAAGLYTRETGNPLRVLAPNNLDYANRAVPLQVVRIP